MSAKSAEPGNASYYYSLTRLATDGTINIGGESFTVSGATWMDHEFGTSALGSDAQGWDWFGLQLDDDRELMVGQIRRTGGSKDPYFGGLLVNPDGTTQYLPAEAISIQSTGTWTSPHTGATYPAGWNIAIDLGGSAPLRLTLTPQIADQELNGAGVVYWEGTVRIAGDAAGYGYAELTGYADLDDGAVLSISLIKNGQRDYPWQVRNLPLQLTNLCQRSQMSSVRQVHPRLQWRSLVEANPASEADWTRFVFSSPLVRGVRHVEDGLQQDVRAIDHVRPFGEFVGMVADAVDRRDEDHAARHQVAQNLRGVPGVAEQRVRVTNRAHPPTPQSPESHQPP